MQVCMLVMWQSHDHPHVLDGLYCISCTSFMLGVSKGGLPYRRFPAVWVQWRSMYVYIHTCANGSSTVDPLCVPHPSQSSAKTSLTEEVVGFFMCLCRWFAVWWIRCLHKRRPFSGNPKGTSLNVWRRSLGLVLGSRQRVRTPPHTGNECGKKGRRKASASH